MKEYKQGEVKEVGFVGCDYKATPSEVLYLIDNLLAEFGLEITELDTGNDSFNFKIEKRN